MRSFTFAVAVLFNLAITLPAVALDVAVSIKPLHSLVSAVMAGQSTPHLIIDGAGSPHDYHLRPSDARALENADVVFWIGEELETFLQSPLKALSHKARVVALQDTANLGRVEKEEDHNDHAHHEDHNHGHDHHGSQDMHLWLDPLNAQIMVQAIADILAKQDPQNGDSYLANAKSLIAKIDKLVQELTQQLALVKDKPSVVFHDAYGHFQQRFDLNIVDHVALSPERLPGAKHLQEVRETIAKTGAVCVFSEPQFRPKLVETVLQGSSAKTAQLDPLGAALTPGPELYFTLMRQLGTAYHDCLTS